MIEILKNDEEEQDFFDDQRFVEQQIELNEIKMKKVRELADEVLSEMRSYSVPITIKKKQETKKDAPQWNDRFIVEQEK